MSSVRLDGAPRSGEWVPGVLSVVLAFLIGGVPGALIVLTAVIDTGTRRMTMPAVTAVALLALAAVATVVEAPLSASTIGLDFALKRPVASAAARLAGVAAVVALLYAASEERLRRVGAAHPPRQHRRLPDSSSRAALAASAGRLRPAVLAAVFALGASAVWPPPPLPARTALAVASMRAGEAGAAGTPPMTPWVALFFPGEVAWASILVGALLVLATMRVAERAAGRVAACWAGAIVAVAGAAAGAGLAEALTALLVVTALARLWPAPASALRAFVAGMCLAGAVLTRPEALVVLLATCAWLLRGRDQWGARPPAAFVLAATVLLWPWFSGLQERVGTWWVDPTSDLSTSPRWWAPVVVAFVAAAAVARLGGLRPPAAALGLVELGPKGGPRR
ncbi:MAG: hypothetical protein KY447_00155 [Actinobacteria bacterium]|nr:hypothetical protein [Actinomycetota bacterium]